MQISKPCWQRSSQAACCVCRRQSTADVVFDSVSLHPQELIWSLPHAGALKLWQDVHMLVQAPVCNGGAQSKRSSTQPKSDGLEATAALVADQTLLKT